MMPDLITIPSREHAALVAAVNQASAYLPPHLRSALTSSSTYTVAEVFAFYPVLTKATEDAWKAGNASAASALRMATISAFE